MKNSINTTASTALATGLNKTFYDRQLLESAKTRFVFSEYGQKRSIPRNNGKRVEFRRWELFDPNEAIDGLQEGVTPKGQNLSQTVVTADLNQYGAYVEVSDMLDLTGYDDVINDSVELLGEQLGTVVEWVTRDALSSGTNVQYAGDATSRDELDPEHKLSMEDIRKAVKSLKKAKTRMFSDNGRKPHYICVCSPDTIHDLQDDPLWQAVSTYSNAENIYSGEIGRMYGVVFVESTEAISYSFSFDNYVAENSTTNVINLRDPLTKKQCDYLRNGGTVLLEGISELEVKPDSLVPGATSIELEVPLPYEPTVDLFIKSYDAMSDYGEVHGTVIFGKDAYGVVSIDGSDAIESIIKPCGSAGASDPLNQRATIGAKVMGYAAKILNELWIVRIEHYVSE